jgi:hypothetical protein
MQITEKSKQRRLEKNLRIVAEVIAHDGSKYWALYDRLDNELKSVKKRRKKLLKHLSD